MRFSYLLRKLIFVCMLLAGLYSCEQENRKTIENAFSDEDVRFGGFMLNGSDYSVQLIIFLNKGEIDVKVERFIEEKPEIVDFNNLSLKCTDGIIWENAVLLNSSLGVAENIRKKMVDGKFHCIDVKIASYSTSVDNSVNYVVYTKACNK